MSRAMNSLVILIIALLMYLAELVNAYDLTKKSNRRRRSQFTKVSTSTVSNFYANEKDSLTKVIITPDPEFESTHRVIEFDNAS